VVHVTGLIANGTANAVEFTLPVGYRPDAQVMLSVNSAAGSTALQVWPNGEVRQQQGATTGYQSVEMSFFVGPDCGLTAAGPASDVNLASFTGTALTTVQQLYGLVLACAVLLVFGVALLVGLRLARP
jgi:hypothetical protein